MGLLNSLRWQWYAHAVTSPPAAKKYRFSLIESNADSAEMVVFIESYRLKRKLNNEVSEGGEGCWSPLLAQRAQKLDRKRTLRAVLAACAQLETNQPSSPGAGTSKLGGIIHSGASMRTVETNSPAAESRTRTELGDQLTRKNRNRIYLFPLYGYLPTVIARWRRC